MNHLVPCPECSRHVRVIETECPFCALPLDLAGTPEPQLPRTRLGRAATFAFGATLASATALAACGGRAEGSDDGNTPSNAGTGGEASVGGMFGGTVYGAPTMPIVTTVGGAGGSGGNTFVGSYGGASYGTPAPGGSGNAGGSGDTVDSAGAPPVAEGGEGGAE